MLTALSVLYGGAGGARAAGGGGAEGDGVKRWQNGKIAAARGALPWCRGGATSNTSMTTPAPSWDGWGCLTAVRKNWRKTPAASARASRSAAKTLSETPTRRRPGGRTTMSEEKHTPGPWKVANDVDVQAGPSGCLAYVSVAGGRGRTLGEAAANAKLCAAAPDLLAACEAMLLFHDAAPWLPDRQAAWERLTGQEHATTRALCDFVRAAIAKARRV
jgi:hypothetical protein